MTVRPGVSLYGNFFQIAYATTDIEQAIWTFQKDYGIARFVVIDNDLALTTPRGPKRVLAKFAFAYLGDTLIEVIHPTGGDTHFYDDILPKDGFGIRHHHIGFKIEGIEGWRAFRPTVGDADHPIAIEGDSGTAKWVYLDERARLGHYLEYVFMEAPLWDFFASVPRT